MYFTIDVIFAKVGEVNIPELGCGFLGDLIAFGEAAENPKKSYLFFFTAVVHGSILSGDMEHWLGKFLAL